MNQSHMLWMLLVPMLAASSLVNGCSSTHDRDHIGGQSGAAQSPTAATPASASTNNRIAVVTVFPKAFCQAHPTDKTTPSDRIVADDSGILRFLTPPPSWGTQLSFDCSTSSGISHTFSVDLQDEANFNEPEDRFTRVLRPKRPTLTGALSSYTRQQVIAMGYPPPPKGNAHRYEMWKQLVTTPVTNAIPVVALGRAKNDSATNNHWGGMMLSDSNADYEYMEFAFYVPRTYDNGVQSQSSIWGGLGGWNTNNVLQAGVELDNPTDYYAWAEYFPYDPGTGNNGVYVYSYWEGGHLFPEPVSANDYITTWCWPSDDLGNWVSDGSASYGYCTMEDQTTSGGTVNWSGGTVIPAPSGGYDNSTAEFIIEAKPCTDPTDTCDPPLTKYVESYMEGFAGDANEDGHDFCTDSYTDITLLNAAAYELSGVVSGSCEATYWQWQNPEPNQ